MNNPGRIGSPAKGEICKQSGDYMAKSDPIPAAPCERGWDIAFTRISREVLQQVDACVQEMTFRFQGIGLNCDRQVRQTPRGVSTFLAVTGDRGLLFIVDITLIDGMAVARQPGAALDIRLLDACGDTVSHCARTSAPGAPLYHASVPDVVAAAGLARSITTVCVTAMAHFDLVPPVGRAIRA